MKLIEKLANDYYQERPEGFGGPTEDFMAGFLKAREMASRLVPHQPFAVIREPYQEISLPEAIATIGEENVSE